MLARARRAGVAAAAAAALLSAGLPAKAAAEIRIIRDRFGVPHVYGATAEDVSYGAGYALAQDRLWQMHVFRLLAKGRLSDLLGPLVLDIDREVRFFTYTAAERAARFATYPEDIRRDLQAFADGVNAWIAKVRSDPSKLPFEFLAYGVGLPDDWTVDDSVALQDVLILAFGSGGGNELSQAALAAELIGRFGEAEGLRMFDDLVVTVDDDGPITIPRGFDYPHEPTYAREAEADSRRALTPDARLGGANTAALPAHRAAAAPRAPALPAGPAGAGREPRAPAIGTLAQLRLVPDPARALAASEWLRRGREALQRAFHFGSNAQIGGPAVSEAHNSVQTAGPQVGYLLPQWLVDIGLHSADGRLDATGMTFAGAGPAVLIGRGRGYAWTTTTGASDLTDTYVERLNPDNPRRYEFNGAWEDMSCRTETFTFRGLVPLETMEICRTRHGPVFAFDEANGVAYSLRYAWFGREGQTVEGFFRYNQVRSLEDFATFANYLSSNHNMFYVDDLGNYGYWHPGNFPIRAEGVDLRLPQDGRGGSEWQGLLPVGRTPHAVNFERGWLSNWNNQPAEGWERERAYAAVNKAADLERALDPAQPAVADPEGGLVNPDRRLDFEDLVGNLRYAAFKHHRDTFFRPFLPPDDALPSDLARRAAEVVRAWDGFLVDRDGDGTYDSAGPTIVDEWVADMHQAVFGRLGDLAGWATDSLLWHVLGGGGRLQLHVDWLQGASPVQVAASALQAAAERLAAQFGTDDPSAWRRPAAMEHYQRLNADLFADTAASLAGLDTSGDSGLPGDVPDHIHMDRGTYNHVVVYQTPPLGTDLGHAVAKAGSVIPPGQSGFIDLAGREAPHYEDQLPLYVQWRFKPMPMSMAEARAVAESETVLRR